ncbi:MAG: M20 family metallopeptidase [Actinomycetia bacterium]|nr:M20 family metallopeptidase [Actinomycetes bacterium]
MMRLEAIADVERHFDDGEFRADLARRVAIKSTAQVPELRDQLEYYLRGEIGPTLAGLGYQWSTYENPDPRGGPFLVAQRHENPDRPTVLTYGHGDVVRGLEGEWSDDRDPWTLDVDGDRWYGRGTADNKGQHSINIAALATVLGVRGSLGFNSTIFLETSEEVGSPGLAHFAADNRQLLAADVLIGSDGPRLQPQSPTMFMGTRGAMNFNLGIDLREGSHHSGNWGGLISNAGTRLANALASLVGPRGEILVEELKPEVIPPSIRQVLDGVEVDGGADGPVVDPEWGEPGLTPAERVFAWNAFEILAFEAGNPAKVVNAIPPRATAWCQIRFTADRDPVTFLPAIRRHLDEAGFGEVALQRADDDAMMRATRLLPDHEWVRWATRSIETTIDGALTVLPNLGGTLPNDVFADILGMPTIWVPHSYASCSQHAPNEHVLAPIMREGLRIMTGLFWDMGEAGTPEIAARE